MTIMVLLAGGAGALSVTTTPPAINTGGTSATFTTPAATALVANGSGSYSYSWAVTESPGITFAVLAPGSASTTFRFTGVVAGEEYYATVRLTVTDTVSLATAFVDGVVHHRDLRPPSFA